MNHADWYDAQRPLMERFTSSMENLLEAALRRAAIQFDTVSARVKSRESFVEKCDASGQDGVARYVDPRTQITDLAGLRVTTYLMQTVPQIEQLIITEFETDGPQLGGREDQGIPGYVSTHFLVRMPSARLMLPENREFGGLVAELQVRTILQHAWAQIQHGVMYKGREAVPDHLRRRLVSLAGLLELADREFRDVSVHLDRDDEVAAAAEEPYAPGEFTAVGLRVLLENLRLPDIPALEWFEELLVVLSELDYLDPFQIRQLLELEGNTRAAVSAALAQSGHQPNAVEVLDALLRFELGQDYFDRRAEFAQLTPDAQRTAQDELHAFRGLVSKGLG